MLDENFEINLDLGKIWRFISIGFNWVAGGWVETCQIVFIKNSCDFQFGSIWTLSIFVNIGLSQFFSDCLNGQA